MLDGASRKNEKARRTPKVDSQTAYRKIQRNGLARELEEKLLDTAASHPGKLHFAAPVQRVTQDRMERRSAGTKSDAKGARETSRNGKRTQIELAYHLP